MRNYKLERLQKGETFVTSEKGNSMSPIIKSGQDHKLAPAKLEGVSVGDIVYCKVKSNFYTHLVKAKGDRGVLIGNNKGGINGWTINSYGKESTVTVWKDKKPWYRKEFRMPSITPKDVKEMIEEKLKSENNVD